MRLRLIVLGLAICASVSAAERDSARLGALAGKPYRPPWGPLPVMRNYASFAPFLREELSSRDAGLRARSAFLLGQIGCRESSKLLARRLRDRERDVRVQSGIALACLGDARGIPVCEAVLKSDLPWIRYYAAYGLWRIGTPRANRILREGLPGQGKLVSTAINGALSTRRTIPPSVRPAKSPPKLAWDDVLDAACNDFILEGDWWWHGGDYEQGIRCMEALVFLDPGDIESFGVIAWLQRSLGRESESVATLKRCIAANPKDPAAHFELGFHYMTDEKYALAEPDLRRSVELGGDHLCIRQYANCLEKLGRPREALELWSKLLAMRPNDSAARFNCDRLAKLLAAGK